MGNIRHVTVVLGVVLLVTLSGCSAPHTKSKSFLGLMREPEFGYKWSRPDDSFSYSVEWQPGYRDPKIPHIAASEEEGKGIPDFGYKLDEDANSPIGLKATWNPNVQYAGLPHMMSGSDQDTWVPVAGYLLVNDPESPVGLKASWNPGSTDVLHPNIHASGVEGQWLPDAGYRWADSTSNNSLDVVAVQSGPFQANNPPQAEYNPIPHAVLKWCSGPVDDPEKESTTHWLMRQACGVGAVATEKQ